MTPEAAPRTLRDLLRDMSDWVGLIEQPAYGTNSIYDELVNNFVPRILAIEAEMQELTDESSEASYLLGRAEAWEAAKPLVRACETREPIDELLVRNLAQSLRYALARSGRGAEAAQPATPVGALDAYDIRIVVRALFTSGLTDDMNPVDRRKAGIRLQGTLRKQRDALAAASEPAGGGDG